MIIRLRRARIIATLLVVVIAATGCVPSSYAVENPQQLHARMTSAQVESIVLDQIHGMERMLGHLVAPARVTRMVMRQGGPSAPGFDAVRWYVEAQGTFVSNRGPAAKLIGPAASGHFEIQDADGSIVGMGFP
jgi:hypothetical protein